MTKPVEQAADVGTEQRILDAAHAVFLRAGTASATLQDVADEAGVARTLLHYYFRNKERLAEAVFQRAAGQVFPAVAEILASDVGIEDKVQRVVAHYVDELARAPYLAGYVICELNQHPERITRFFGGEAARPEERVAGSRAGAPAAGGRGQLRARARVVLGEQLRARAREGTLRAITVEQFLVNLMALCIFPFAARPMVEAMLGMGDAAFRRFVAQRRKELPTFFLKALQP